MINFAHTHTHKEDRTVLVKAGPPSRHRHGKGGAPLHRERIHVRDRLCSPQSEVGSNCAPDQHAQTSRRNGCRGLTGMTRLPRKMATPWRRQLSGGGDSKYAALFKGCKRRMACNDILKKEVVSIFCGTREVQLPSGLNWPPKILQ